MRRPTSSSNIANRNTSWLDSNSTEFFVFYWIMIIISWFLISVLINLFAIDTGYSWTITHLVHTAITFMVMHWAKGNPDIHTQDGAEFEKLTWWEQVDGGRQYTFNRKFLTISPIIIFLLACYGTEWDKTTFMWNIIVLGFAIVPKSGMMHRQRILGINR